MLRDRLHPDKQPRSLLVSSASAHKSAQCATKSVECCHSWKRGAQKQKHIRFVYCRLGRWRSPRETAVADKLAVHDTGSRTHSITTAHQRSECMFTAWPLGAEYKMYTIVRSLYAQ